MTPFSYFVECSWQGFIFALLIYFFFYCFIRGLHYLEKL